MDLHTRRLRHFVTLAERLHFTRAATALNVSQQGLSRSISELEEQVGVPLLVRTTRSVTLTAAGEVFLVGARAVLVALDEAGDAARSSDGQVAGSLRVGFTVSSALELTSAILRAFQARHPAVSTELVMYRWSDPSCGLRDGATDIAFLRMPIDLKGLQAETVLVEPRAIAVHTSHPLAAARSVTLSDLAGEPIMTPGTDDATWTSFWTLRDTGADEDALPTAERLAESMEEELEVISAGLAISITAISMSRFTPRPSIVFRAISDVAGSEIALGWRGAGTPLTEAFRAVTMEVRDSEPDLVARIASASGYPEEF